MAVSIYGSGYRAVFLDKDGTLIEPDFHGVESAAEAAQVRLLPDVAAGLRRLQEAGYLLIVVTNEAGVARGDFSEEALAGVKRRVKDLLSAEGVRLSAFYYCPHDPEGSCTCRKPLPGLLLRAADDHHVDLSRSWMIGDTAHDTAAGRLAGCGTVLIAPSPASPEARIRPDHVAATLAAAAVTITAADTARVGAPTDFPAGTAYGAPPPELVQSQASRCRLERVDDRQRVDEI